MCCCPAHVQLNRFYGGSRCLNFAYQALQNQNNKRAWERGYVRIKCNFISYINRPLDLIVGFTHARSAKFNICPKLQHVLEFNRMQKCTGILIEINHFTASVKVPLLSSKSAAPLSPCSYSTAKFKQIVHAFWPLINFLSPERGL